MRAWLPRVYLEDLTKSLEKAVSVAKNVAQLPELANAQPVYEEWDVEVPPKAAPEQHFAASLSQYALRGNVVTGFVVDSTGHVVPSTVTVYECEDPNLAIRWQIAVTQWQFEPGSRDGHHVATATGWSSRTTPAAPFTLAAIALFRVALRQTPTAPRRTRAASFPRSRPSCKAAPPSSAHSAREKPGALSREGSSSRRRQTLRARRG